jgi:hypothetical protein
MSENVQRDGSRDCKKENPDFERRKKNEEIISRNCLPHHKTASTFINMHKQARLHLLCMLSRYYAMSESVQRDDHRSSFHDMVHFRYDEQRPALHAEGLKSQTCWIFPDTLKRISLYIIYMGFGRDHKKEPNKGKILYHETLNWDSTVYPNLSYTSSTLIRNYTTVQIFKVLSMI